MAFPTFSQISGSILGRGIKRYDCLKKSRKKSRINFSPRGKLRRLIYVETEVKQIFIIQSVLSWGYVCPIDHELVYPRGVVYPRVTTDLLTKAY